MKIAKVLTLQMAIGSAKIMKKSRIFKGHFWKTIIPM